SAGRPIYGPAYDPGHPYHGQPYGPTEAVEAMGPIADLPAGLDAEELAAVPATSARRGRLRRRVAFLRAARELPLRDLGGLVYELHRTAGDIEHEAHRRLRATKLERLTRVDSELHELELRLDDVRRHVVVREPGVGGECPECGELFGSDAHYCSHCGLPLTESARRALARAASEAPEPAIAGELPAGPVPTAGADQPTQEIHPSEGGEFAWPQRGAAPATAVGGRAWSRHDAAAQPAPEGGAAGSEAASGAAAGESAPGAGGDATSGEAASGATTGG